MKLSELPTTNLRIVVTLGVYAATSLVYLGYAVARLWLTDAKPWVPSWDFMVFIGVMSGIDVTQYIGKRRTHIPTGRGRAV